MDGDKSSKYESHEEMMAIRLDDLLPKDNNTVIGGKTEMIFGITRNPVEKGQLTLITE